MSKSVNYYLSCLFIVFTAYGCVSQSEYDKVLEDLGKSRSENEQLKRELNDIKFGAPTLFQNGIKFFDGGNYIKAKENFLLLTTKHPNMPQSIEAANYLVLIEEEELWAEAKISEDISVADKYISKYPSGKYISLANARASELAILNMQKAYDAASTNNSSSSWKQFLDTYPDHPEASAIRKKIIRLEVDEIYGNQSTGRMPTFNQNSVSYSATSSVEIGNDTGCELSVRYSGPDAEIITIPAGRTKTIYLSSGSYRIVASACGSNYAGTENLQGRYSSRFYISTYRY